MLDALAADAGLTPGWQQIMETISANEVRVPARRTTITIRYHAANGWVEPASMTAPGGGVPNHFHAAFDGRTNTNYGDACTN
jgi:hypothetical protein